MVQKEQIAQQIERDVINAWDSYQNALFILKTEEKNVIKKPKKWQII